MALTWDLTKVNIPKEKMWIKNTDGEDILNALTEVMIITTMFVGIREITEKNYKDFYKRIKEFEVASGLKGMLIDKGKEVTEGKERKERMPNLEEVKIHIGLNTNSEEMTKRKWHSNIKRIVTETANENIRIEKSIEEENIKVA